jgi:uncharacterized delta-60 repeat protein
MLKKRTMVVSAALAAAVLIGVLIWNWNRPTTSNLTPAASGETPNASLGLLSPGILSVALGSANTDAQGLALQRDGTIVVGATFASESAPGLSKSRAVVLHMTSNGRLANPAVTPIANTPTGLRGLATARDGTIVAFGTSAGPEGHFLLARLLPDGTLDPAFGNGAVLANMKSSMFSGGTALGVAIQDDGKIVATGSAGYAAGPFAQGSYCATARFNRDGRFDRSFGDSGRLLTSVDGKQFCSAPSVLVAPDGKIIVVGGYRAEHEPPHIALFRYLPDGTPDRQFGREGIVQLLRISAIAWGGAAFDSQGRIVVVGTEQAGSSTNWRFLVVRFDPNGSLDQSFGTGGIASLAGGSVFQQLVAVALQQDGKLVAVGNTGWRGGTRPAEPGKRNEIVVTRLDANGALDQSFAGGGLLIMGSPRYLWSAGAIAIAPDGKLLIAGGFADDENERVRSSIVLIRLNPDGTPDADFGRGADTP